MLIIDSLLFSGIRFVLDKVAAAVDTEMNDDTALRERLLAAQMQVELGEMTQKEFDDLEADILARLRDIRDRQRGGQSVISRRDMKVTGIEATFEATSTRASPPVWHLFGGKGGVGKTTCAAAMALESARHRRTLLVSTDPASSLGDALGVRVSRMPVRVPGAGTLDAADIDADRAFATWLDARREALGTLALRGTYLDQEDVGRLLRLSLPGIDELIGLLEIVRLSSGRYDLVVIDTAPTGHTLRLLGSPVLMARLAALLDALQERHRAVVAALRGAYTTDAPDALIAEIDRDAADIAARLRHSTTRLSWVTLPEPMALEETSDAVSALDQAGLRVHTLFVNRTTVVPPQPCGWCAARRRFEARAVAPVARRFPAVEILSAPELTPEPRGILALRRLARVVQPWGRSTTRPRPVARRIRADTPKGRRAGPGDLLGSARWVLFGGKGGVGKSTCAAAAAIHLARRNASARVLLLSSDPAHSLGDVFGARFGDEPVAVAGGPSNLHVREIDAERQFEQFRAQYLNSVDAVFEGIARGALDVGADRRAFQQLIDVAPPGIDEVIAIAGVARALTGPHRPYDLVVSDTAPSGHALRMLQTPAVLREWTQALMAMLLKYRQVVRADALARLLVQLSKELRSLDAVLRNPSETRFVIVTRPAALPRIEAVRLQHALQELRIQSDTIIVNAAGVGQCSRCRGVGRVQRAEIARLRRSLPRGSRYAIIVAPAEMPPPHGVASLAAWAASWQRADRLS